jgi:hypothetical protein
VKDTRRPRATTPRESCHGPGNRTESQRRRTSDFPNQDRRAVTTPAIAPRVEHVEHNRRRVSRTARLHEREPWHARGRRGVAVALARRGRDAPVRELSPDVAAHFSRTSHHRCAREWSCTDCHAPHGERRVPSAPRRRCAPVPSRLRGPGSTSIPGHRRLRAMPCAAWDGWRALLETNEPASASVPHRRRIGRHPQPVCIRHALLGPPAVHGSYADPHLRR